MDNLDSESVLRFLAQWGVLHLCYLAGKAEFEAFKVEMPEPYSRASVVAYFLKRWLFTVGVALAAALFSGFAFFIVFLFRFENWLFYVLLPVVPVAAGIVHGMKDTWRREGWL